MGLLLRLTIGVMLILARTISAQLPAGEVRQDIVAADSASPTMLPGLVVTASRLSYPLLNVPSAVTLLPIEGIPRAITPSLSQSLNRVPGFRPTSTGNIWGKYNLDVRGFYGAGQAQYVLVTYDRIPLNEFSSGVSDLADMSFAETEVIETIKGPVSAQYGDIGFGGLIALRSAQAGPHRPTFAEITAASEAGFGFEGYLGGEIAGVQLMLAPTVRTHDGWREHSQLDSRRIFAKLTGTSGSSMWTGLMAIGNTEEDIPGALTAEQLASDRTQAATDFAGNPLPDKRSSTQFLTGISAVIPVAEKTVFYPMLYGRYLDQDNVTTITSSLEHQPEQVSVGGELSLGTNVLLEGRDLQLVGGVSGDYGKLSTEYRELEARQIEPVVRGRGERTGVGLFFQSAYHLTGLLTVSLGARFDHIATAFEHDMSQMHAEANTEKQAENSFSPNLAVGYALTEHLTARASVAGAFKAPTLVHLYDSPPIFFLGPENIPSYLVISNADLSPLKGTSYEVGLRYAPDERTYFSLDGYWYDISDEIDFDPATFRYRNAGKSRHQGAELLGMLQPSPLLGLRLELANTHATFQETPYFGNQVNGVPRWSFGFEATLSPLRRLQITGRLSGQLGQYLDQANQFELGDYAVTDFGVSYGATFARVSAGVTNVFDRVYSVDGYIGVMGEERYYPAAGRLFTLTLRITP